MKDIAPLNVDLPAQELHRVRVDVVDCKTTMKDYTRIALLHFRHSLTKAQRLDKLPNRRESKITGRTVKI